MLTPVQLLITGFVAVLASLTEIAASPELDIINNTPPDLVLEIDSAAVLTGSLPEEDILAVDDSHPDEEGLTESEGRQLGSYIINGKRMSKAEYRRQVALRARAHKSRQSWWKFRPSWRRLAPQYRKKAIRLPEWLLIGGNRRSKNETSSSHKRGGQTWRIIKAVANLFAKNPTTNMNEQDGFAHQGTGGLHNIVGGADTNAETSHSNGVKDVDRSKTGFLHPTHVSFNSKAAVPVSESVDGNGVQREPTFVK